MLADVFWHWKRPEITRTTYEDRQRDFHAALGNSAAPGFINSFSFGVSKAPWAAHNEAYEDWYLVRDFGALGLLNEAAVTNSRAARHCRLVTEFALMATLLLSIARDPFHRYRDKQASHPELTH